MLSEEQLNYIKDNEDFCWYWSQNGPGYILIFPVIKHENAGPYSFAIMQSFEKHELTRDDIIEYFKGRIFNEDMKELLK